MTSKYVGQITIALKNSNCVGLLGRGDKGFETLTQR